MTLRNGVERNFKAPRRISACTASLQPSRSRSTVFLPAITMPLRTTKGFVSADGCGGRGGGSVVDIRDLAKKSLMISSPSKNAENSQTVVVLGPCVRRVSPRRCRNSVKTSFFSERRFGVCCTNSRCLWAKSRTRIGYLGDGGCVFGGIR